MYKLNFIKMVGAGNDFIILDFGVKGGGLRVKDFSKLARQLCDRKTGIGADGVLILEKSKMADFRMRIFNADGSEAEMCGNGLRCAVLFTGKKKTNVETKAGIYDGEITARNRVKIRMENPKDLRQDFLIKVNLRDLKVNYINTGVPHIYSGQPRSIAFLIADGNSLNGVSRLKPKNLKPSLIFMLII